MKRLLCIAAALLVAGLFALPTAAIASLDGTEPVFNGDAGIVPLSDSISPLARSEGAPVQAYAALALAVCAVLGLMSLAALLLSTIALVKVRRIKAAEKPATA